MPTAVAAGIAVGSIGQILMDTDPTIGKNQLRGIVCGFEASLDDPAFRNGARAGHRKEVDPASITDKPQDVTCRLESVGQEGDAVFGLRNALRLPNGAGGAGVTTSSERRN